MAYAATHGSSGSGSGSGIGSHKPHSLGASSSSASSAASAAAAVDATSPGTNTAGGPGPGAAATIAHTAAATTTTECCGARAGCAVAHRCPHLAAWKAAGGVDSYRGLCRYLLAAAAKLTRCSGPHHHSHNHSHNNHDAHASGNHHQRVPAQVPLPRCAVCGSLSGRLHACLQCVYIGCWEDKHLNQHFGQTGHHLAMDVAYRQLYCAHCGDYVYDSDLDAVGSAEMAIASGGGAERTYGGGQQSTVDLKEVQQNTKPYQVPSHLLGLRGLHNLGNTCFMNCILQSFLHNPLLRNYFLADMHSRSLCTRAHMRDSTPMQGGDDEPNDLCLACELDYLFTNVYLGSGMSGAYVPAHFLYSMWRFADTFAGYEQQDAHEFLIATLNGLHKHSAPIKQQNGGTDAPPIPHSGNPQECSCVVHKIFGGYLQSEITCQRCGRTSTAVDPFFDISLDIPKPRARPRLGSRGTTAWSDEDMYSADNSGAGHISNGGIDSMIGDDQEEDPFTIQACLRRFTMAERLGAEGGFRCKTCADTYQESTKRLSLRTLPVVLTLHLKRFKQTGRESIKIDTHIKFPSQINMAPYTAQSIKGEVAAEEWYDLFAVVEHRGKMDNGHFVFFVRHSPSNGHTSDAAGPRWYKCDDATITPTPNTHIQSINAYLLFYIRRTVEYSRGSDLMQLG